MIGDVLASSIICTNLKKMYPNAVVEFMVYKHTVPVIENNPYIDKILIFEEKYRQSKLAFFSFLLQIRKKKYDIVIDVYGKIESNLIVFFVKAPIKIGLFKNRSKFLFTHTIQENFASITTAGAAIDNRLNLLSPLQPKITLDRKPKIYLTENEIQEAKIVLTNNAVDMSKKVYMISLLGSDVTKTYPKEYMAKVLDSIVLKSNATLLFNYMPKQKNEVQLILNLCKLNTVKQCKPEIFPGGIRQFLALTYHCNALIGNEGGAVNMAKAIDIPTFTLFSPWIIKNAWNSFENGTTNVSIHLKDYLPEVYEGKFEFEFKKQSLSLYKKFEPQLFEDTLFTFLKNN